MISNDRYRASYIVLFTRIIGNITQAYPTELPPTAVFNGIVGIAIEDYRPIHRSEWPLGQRYQNYRHFTEYQAREFILGRIAGWLLVKNTMPRGRQPDFNIFRPNEREVEIMQRYGTLVAYNNT